MFIVEEKFKELCETCSTGLRTSFGRLHKMISVA